MIGTKAMKSEDNQLVIVLSDGREISVPLEWFSKLRDASENQRANWRLIGKGVGVHWEEIDEDISVEGLLEYKRWRDESQD